MKQINISEAHITSTQNLTEIKDDEWNIINKQKCYFILSDSCDKSFIKFPGYVFSNMQAKNCYMRIYNDFISQNIFTPSRGNLSKNNNYIFIGIRPGHAFAHLSKAEIAWLYGPSSSLLHELLDSLNIYPYFTNIYNEYTKPFNKDFKFIFKEMVVVLYIYKYVYNIDEVNIVFMGNYDEYPLFKTLLNNNEIIKRFDIKLNFYKIWHPGYLARSYSVEKFEEWKKQLK